MSFERNVQLKVNAVSVASDFGSSVGQDLRGLQTDWRSTPDIYENVGPLLSPGLTALTR
jgi:hypothetical protein